MARLIDADTLPTGRVEWEDIVNAPTVDAVPVIRCKDCKHHEYEYEENGMVYCSNIVGCWVDEEGYCYLAERRNDETD